MLNALALLLLLMQCGKLTIYYVDIVTCSMLDNLGAS